MALILNIETATAVCSVALSDQGRIIALNESAEGYTHAENLTLFIRDVLKEAGTTMSAIDAVAVSKGPGSYTGLRIGVSAAKGICFATGKPLIAVPTLKSMAAGAAAKEQETGLLFCPMIDARRMEVYCAIYNAGLEEVAAAAAVVVDKNSFLQLLSSDRVMFFGDGAPKCREQLSASPNAMFASYLPSAANMAPLAEKAFAEKKFEDAAYFEPFYLKDFVSTSKTGK